MQFGKWALLAITLLRGDQAMALSHSVSFQTKDNFASARQLKSAFDNMVDSTAFIERSTTHGSDVYKVPLFGEDCVVSFEAADSNGSPVLEEEETPSEFVLKVDGASKDDFGWICLKFYETRKSFTGIDMKNLRSALSSHMNQQPPHPGYDASLARLARSSDVQNLFGATSMKQQAVLDELARSGYVVLDAGPKISEQSNQKLSDFLIHRTGQDKKIRTDTVAFLLRDEAISCGLKHQFDLLMGISSYLNTDYDFDPSTHAPVLPGTSSNPLTNPKAIQAAEYGKDNFYVAHSDNSWAEGKHLSLRRNFRSFTCILYCNDDWQEQDGGALRIYRDSTHLASVDEAHKSCEYSDIVPKNGHLVIFDSKLVHSVERVLVDKCRRALTIWITRPSDGGIQGESIYVPP